MATSITGRSSRLMLLMVVVDLLILSAIDRSSADPRDRDREPKVRNKAKNFLAKFGYARTNDSSQISDSDFTDSLKAMQAFASLPETGVLDDATMALLDTPRCGHPDHVHGNRGKRYALFGTYWSNPLSMTYNINNYPSATLTSTAVQSILASSFKMWSNAACLRFTKLISSAANIQIGFYSYDHSDNYPFDGPLGVLAHAFYPTNGRTHFDNSETWTNGTTAGINLLQVAVHELGHALGLSHSSVQSAIMYPYYSGYVPNFALDPDDIAGIRALYGYCTSTTPSSTTKTTTKPTSTTKTSTTKKPTTTTRLTTTTKRPTTTCRLVCG